MMAIRKLFKAFVLAALMTCLKCQKKIPGSTENADITRFYDKNGVIWTLETTEPTTIRCKFDVVNKSTHHGVRLMRQYYWIGSRTNFYLDGTFMSKRSKEHVQRNEDHRERVSRILYGTFYEHRRKHMDVKPKGKGVSFQEDLLYVSGDKSCAVIMVTTNVGAKHVTYDLRVKNSHIRSPPHPKCLYVYEKFERHGQVLYDPSYQGILAKSANSKV
nr:uncharacterized protein LOC119168440 [Rhipicephalus microplus]